MAKPKKIKLNNKDNEWSGSGKNEQVWGNGGDDDISGGGGNDKLNGGDGNDILRGGGDDDKLIGGAGDDALLGGAGDDTITAGVGNDTVDGGAGDDVVKIAGNLADATVVMDGDFYAITLNGVTTRVKNVELFKFTDGTVGTAKLDEIIAGSDGETFTLTTSANTVDGTAEDDTIDGSTVDTWNAFDDIDGGDGADTMNVLLSGAVVPGSATVVNVENLNVNTTGAGFTIDTTSFTGLTALKLASSTAGAIEATGATTTSATIVGTGASSVDVIGFGGALSVSTGADAVNIGQTAVINALTSVSVTGGTTIDISDNKTVAGADGTTLTTVSVSDFADDVTLDTDGLTTLNISNMDNATTDGDVSVNAAAGTRALTATLNNVDTSGDGAATVGGFTLTDATATSVNLKSATKASYDVTVVAAAATAVTIDADVALQLDALTTAAAKTVSISGDSAVTIDAHTLAADAAITSTNAAGVTFTSALGTGVDFDGGDGSDAITLGATTKGITMGAGDDKVTLSATVTALGTGGSIDAGAGTNDTLAFAESDDAGTASAGTTFEASISGFEQVELASAATAAIALNLANLDDLSKVKVSANLGQALTITNMASGGTVTYTATQGSTTAIGVSNAVVGSTDVVNVAIAGAAGIDTGALTIADVETVNFVTDDTATTTTSIEHVSSLTAASVKTITVSGDAGLTLTYIGTTLTSFDASAVTDGNVTWTSGILASDATIKGSLTEINTINLSASAKNMTYTGGSEVDTVTFGAGNNSVTTGAGNDVIIVGNGNNTINAGDGDDSITLGSGANTVNTGAGANTVVFNAAMTGLNVITLGSGVDTLDFNAVPTAAGFYASVIGVADGDKFDFVGAGIGTTVAEATLGSAITLGGAASFANYLDAAAAGTAGVNGVVNWFQLNGDTYIVLDNSTNATFTDGVDMVIELDGLVDLSTSVLAAEVLTI